MRLNEVPTPSYVIDEGKLKSNLEILRSVKERTGCKILLAQKAFSNYCEYPLIGEFLDGCTASSLYEARLGFEEMGKENHIFSPAFKESELEDIAAMCDHVVFNSFSQLHRFGNAFMDVKKSQTLSRKKAPSVMSSGEESKGAGIGLRLNPECSTQEGHAIYDPCAPGSRLGITPDNFLKGIEKYREDFKMVEGFHFHTLCEQNSDDLETTLKAVEEKFGEYIALPQIKWLNMGGGHHITREDYDIERLVRLIDHVKDRYNVQVYLEPGEAIALNAGYLVTTVLDTVENGITTLLLDTSAACHMPDVLEMPYRPPLKGAGMPDEKAFTYRLSSCTCLAGDVIGDYSFDKEIGTGDRLYFEDMAIYSMVKNNTFNGIALPSIYAMDEAGECRLIKEFGYQDFKMRL